MLCDGLLMTSLLQIVYRHELRVVSTSYNKFANLQFVTSLILTCLLQLDEIDKLVATC